MQDLSSAPWLNNNLFPADFIAQKADELTQQPLPRALEPWLQAHFTPGTLAACNEAQLEHGFINPLLARMGWHTVPQMNFTVQGKLAKPDWCLALDAAQAAALPAADAAHACEQMAVICEAKAWRKPLDTGRANADNPHHQLMDYLATLRVRFGFLTNGRHWRLYDTREITARKTFLEFDLEAALQLPAGMERQHALALFAFFFGRDTYAPKPAAAISPIEQTISDAQSHALAVEENLKAVIYGFDGEDSLFEQMGKGLWQANHPRPTLAALYENTVILLFRLLFIVYFEDRNRELLAAHPFYGRYSLKNLYARLRAGQDTVAEQQFDGIHDLKELFKVLDKGATDIDIPLFNGGLFDANRAPLLNAPKIFGNATLRQLLEKLLYRTRRGETLFDAPRDFNTMSVTHLGRIYEGLLEFRFEQANENATYLEYSSAATKGKPVEAYFDAWDVADIRKGKDFRQYREFSVKAGDIYLKSASNSRKTSASYYTPAALAKRLVEAGISHSLAQGKALTDIRVLDNACGSGHFLVEALNFLTDKAMATLSQDANLQKLVQEENEKIAAQLAALNLPEQAASDAQIIKRVLLKRCIYGVDLNPFAVELARLSLWMDSFIFGTPLSFIEHHIRHGNALLGASVADFIAYNQREQQGDLFVDNLTTRFDELRHFMTELDALRDTTAAEVAQSKTKWREDIAPRLALLGRALSFLSTRRMLEAAGDKKAAEALDKTPNLIDVLFDSPLNTPPAGVLRAIAEHEARWHFFHYEVAFPEAFGAADVAQCGFDVVIGNPPWDKTKLAETDFFPQYHSNYRSLNNSGKAAVQKRLLDKKHIADAWAAAKQHAEQANEALKALYPLNRGAGDGNLFRFFTERNLGLLAAGGSLNYCLPSALMFEEGSLALRQHILTRYRMAFFHSFENREKLFPEVDERYKFALMQVIRPAQTDTAQTDTAQTGTAQTGTAQTGTAQHSTAQHSTAQHSTAQHSTAQHSTAQHSTAQHSTAQHSTAQHSTAQQNATAPSDESSAEIDTAFYLLNPDDLETPARHVPYTLETIRTLSPHQWALMELHSADDLPLLRQCYSAWPALSPEWLNFRAELHMTADKDLFIEREAPGLLPLYEGKMFWQFNHRHAQPQYWLDPVAFDERLHGKEIHRMAQDLGVKKTEAARHANAIRFDREFVRLAFRDIASDTNERTLIFSLLPKGCGAGNKAPVSIPKRYEATENSVAIRETSLIRLLFALAVFNSLTVDWLARFMVQTTVNLTYLYRLPMPQPTDDEILAHPVYRQLARNALRLTLHAGWADFAADLAPAMQQLNVTAQDVPSGPKPADQLRAENDHAIARLYGLTPRDLAHILKSFPVMAKKRPEYVALFQA